MRYSLPREWTDGRADTGLGPDTYDTKNPLRYAIGHALPNCVADRKRSGHRLCPAYINRQTAGLTALNRVHKYTSFFLMMLGQTVRLGRARPGDMCGRLGPRGLGSGYSSRL